MKKRHLFGTVALTIFLLSVLTVFGQQIEARWLSPNERIVREMTGEEGHYYGFELKENEFLQVKIEQKGIDIFVRVLSKDFEPLASWYGVTGNQGIETLSFIAPKSGIYLLGIAMYDNKSDKGSYVLQRGESRLATPKDKRRIEAERLFVEAGDTRDAEIIISKLNKSLLIWKELGDVELQKQTELLIRQITNSKAYFVFNEAMELINGNDEESLKKSVPKFQEALRLSKENKDKKMEAQCLAGLGKAYYSLYEYRKALEHLNLALDIFRAIQEKNEEAYILFSIATNYFRLNENLNAIKFAQLSLPILRETGDKEEEANVLIDIGLYYRALGEREKSTESFLSALSVLTKIGNKRIELRTLNRIGVNYWFLREAKKALEYYNRALKIAQDTGNKDVEAETLNNIGETYNSLLRDYSEALKYFNLALEIRKTEINKHEQAKILNNIGTVYKSQDDIPKALEFFNQAIQIAKENEYEELEVTTLMNIGSIYSSQEDYKKALESFNFALLKANSSKKKNDAYTASLNSRIGDIYLESGEYQKAVSYFAQALQISKFVGDKITEADVLENMARVYVLSKHRRMAIFFYKLYVNKLQEMRGTARGLDTQSQKLLLSRIIKSYQALAEIMILDGENALAIQVLNLYKDQQFFDFNLDLTSSVKQVLLSPREQEFADKFDKLGKKLGEINSQIENLKLQTKNRPPTEQESTQLKKLQFELETATQEYYGSFNIAYQDFTKELNERDKVPSVADVGDIQAVVREISANTNQKAAAVYQFVGFENLTLLVITSDGIKSVSIPVKGPDLNKKALDFWALLQSPAYDPNLVGKELYDLVFKPLENVLPKDTRTILWSLDGNLRYVPMAALFDGKQYLAERYNHVNFTRADKERMTRGVKPVWTATGFGTSEEKTVELLGNRISFEALPGVGEEFKMLFKPKGAKSDEGIFEGEILRDAAFTKRAMLDALKQERPLVHIASHFSFRPGDEARSFLLLGDGTAFTLEEMKREANLFKGVDLLTLSACNTAAQQASANGREIDGFAELAQRLGANSVMATLWSVADNSTPWLMREFYDLKSNKNKNKAEALRQAQIALLKGVATVKPAPARTDLSPVKIILTDKKTDANRSGVYYLDKKDAPLWDKAKHPPFAHPFYWSPFILFGNWK